MIKLRTLNRKELAYFVSSGEFQSYHFLPITKHRAVAQCKNGNAGEDDILLILAFEEDSLAGYLGLFPDVFHTEKGLLKFAWPTTIFVDENFRGKKIAQKMLDKAIEKYDGNLVLTEFTKEAESLYNKNNIFSYISPKDGFRYYLRSDLENLLPKKYKKTAPLKPVLKLTDSAINLISHFVFKTQKPKLQFEILENIDDESAEFIEHFNPHRSAEHLNTAIKFPWILIGKPLKNYRFSSYDKSFQYFWVKIFEFGKIKHCALLSLRNGQLKIPYFFWNNDVEVFVHFLYWFMKEQNIKVFICYHKEINKVFTSNNSFFFLRKKNIERRYLFHRSLLHKLPKNFEPRFQDGDGDCMFT